MGGWIIRVSPVIVTPISAGLTIAELLESTCVISSMSTTVDGLKGVRDEIWQQHAKKPTPAKDNRDTLELGGLASLLGLHVYSINDSTYYDLTNASAIKLAEFNKALKKANPDPSLGNGNVLLKDSETLDDFISSVSGFEKRYEIDLQLKEENYRVTYIMPELKIDDMQDYEKVQDYYELYKALVTKREDGERMRKLLVLFCVGLLVSGCKPTQAPYTDAEAKVFENKLEKASITFEERMIGDFGTMRIVLNLPETTKVEFSVEYYAAYVEYEQLKRDPFNFSLDIGIEYRGSTTESKKPTNIGINMPYSNYANHELDNKWMIGVVVDETEKRSDGGREYCVYKFKDDDYSDFEDVRRCTDKEVKQIINVKEEKEKIYEEAGISDDDVMRYYSWYVMKEKNIK